MQNVGKIQLSKITLKAVRKCWAWLLKTYFCLNWLLHKVSKIYVSERHLLSSDFFLQRIYRLLFLGFWYREQIFIFVQYSFRHFSYIPRNIRYLKNVYDLAYLATTLDRDHALCLSRKYCWTYFTSLYFSKVSEI